jgi:hypothetical protein
MNCFPRAVSELFNHKYAHITNNAVARYVVEPIEYDHINQFIWRMLFADNRWWYIASLTCQGKS